MLLSTSHRTCRTDTLHTSGARSYYASGGAPPETLTPARPTHRAALVAPQDVASPAALREAATSSVATVQRTSSCAPFVAACAPRAGESVVLRHPAPSIPASKHHLSLMPASKHGDLSKHHAAAAKQHCSACPAPSECHARTQAGPLASAMSFPPRQSQVLRARPKYGEAGAELPSQGWQCRFVANAWPRHGKTWEGAWQAWARAWQGHGKHGRRHGQTMASTRPRHGRGTAGTELPNQGGHGNCVPPGVTD